jgi:RimJ/RimL family protein N-acetyltransferase
MDDLEAAWEVEADPEVHRYERPPLTFEDVRERIEKSVANAQTDQGGVIRSSYRLAAILAEEEKLIGRVHLTVTQPHIREWEVGWTIHHAYWGHGYASEAAKSLLHLAFTELQAHRVVAFCHVNNAASTRVMEKIGMQYEAHLRETVWLNERWWDELVYGILEREYNG